jgi:hypothetical protein
MKTRIAVTLTMSAFMIAALAGEVGGIGLIILDRRAATEQGSVPENAMFPPKAVGPGEHAVCFCLVHPRSADYSRAAKNQLPIKPC